MCPRPCSPLQPLALWLCVNIHGGGLKKPARARESNRGKTYVCQRTPPHLAPGTLYRSTLALAGHPRETDRMYPVDRILAGQNNAAFQMATLDNHGVLKIWTVVELQLSDQDSMSAELGLLPGGRIKLSSSATIQLTSVRQGRQGARAR